MIDPIAQNTLNLMKLVEQPVKHMKLNDYSMIINPGDCDVCGRKDQPGIEIYRNAKRHEREHFQVQICETCVLELRATVQIKPQPEAA